VTITTPHNPYLSMPLTRVAADARHGVSLARAAWRERDPAGAALALGLIIESREQQASSKGVVACPARGPDA